MYKVLRTLNDKEKYRNLVNMFNSGLKGLKEEIKKMSKEEIENERPDEIVNIVEMILDLNKKNQQKGQDLGRYVSRYFAINKILQSQLNK